MTGFATLFLVAVFLAGFSLGYWQGLHAAWNDPPPHEWLEKH